MVQTDYDDSRSDTACRGRFECVARSVRRWCIRAVPASWGHPVLADALQARRAASLATPKAKVFPTTVTDRTRLKDFLRAGLAREEVITDEAGEPVMVGEGKRRRPKMRITTEDEDGRVIDLHAMRTTLGTNLAREGVAPQLAQRIMRHSDYRTTLKHYTVLGLNDLNGAIQRLGDVTARQTAQATGTTDADPACSSRRSSSGANQRDSMQGGAYHGAAATAGRIDSEGDKTLQNAGQRDATQSGASKRVTGLEPATFSLGS